MRALLVVGLSVCIPFVNAAEATLEKDSYTSAFDQYQKWKPVGTSDWVNANRVVDEIGGWRYYTQEPYRKDESSSMPTGHQHHSMGGHQ